MQKELEQIIKANNLEVTRIQVGRQRIYPQREGLNATPAQLESLKSVLAGQAIKGSLKITAGETVIAANTNGKLETPFVSSPTQAKQEPMQTVEARPAAEPVKPTKKQFDYPTAAQTLDPIKPFVESVQRGAATLQTQAVTTKDTLQLAQKNLSTFATHVKHRGFKAWAKDQIPILQNKAREMIQTQGAKLGEYVKEQGPVLRDAAMEAAKQATQNAAQILREQGPVVGTKLSEMAGQVSERFAELTRRIDPAQMEQLGATILKQDERFEGNIYTFEKAETGIDISLKDGTPVFSGGKLNPTIDTSHAIHLTCMAEQLEAVKAVVQEPIEEKRKAVAR